EPAPEPEPDLEPLAVIRAALDDSEGNPLALPQAAHALRTALGKARADTLVAEVVGRKAGMWRALFARGVPGWRLEGERVFRVQAAPATAAKGPVKAVAAAPAPTASLDALRGLLGALVDAGVTDASGLNSQARVHWGEALDALVAQTAGGVRAGRWIRFLKGAVPALTVVRQGTHWQVIRADQAGQPVRPTVCDAVRAAAAALPGPVTQRDFVRRLQGAIPAHLARIPTGFDSVTALLKAFPDVIRLELEASGRLRVHPMPGAHPPPLSATGGPASPTAPASEAPSDELAVRRARQGTP
ncbi:MAG: hypothetical protein KC613_04965, partial [Myxococcales bacterium]|nr:hypothetical protein [Myxococcales bacterium]